MMNEQVILVNEQDEVLGYADKLAAHQKGLLHRAISVFIFNSRGQLLLQRRALHKYHTAGLWSNTACSHPRKNEETMAAAHRRLKEEMGISTALIFAFAFRYKSSFDNGLVEHELDHVFYGYSDEPPRLNPLEVDDYVYIGEEELMASITAAPQLFSPWFILCYKKVFAEATHQLQHINRVG